MGHSVSLLTSAAVAGVVTLIIRGGVQWHVGTQSRPIGLITDVEGNVDKSAESVKIDWARSAAAWARDDLFSKLVKEGSFPRVVEGFSALKNTWLNITLVLPEDDVMEEGGLTAEDKLAIEELMVEFAPVLRLGNKMGLIRCFDASNLRSCLGSAPDWTADGGYTLFLIPWDFKAERVRPLTMAPAVFRENGFLDAVAAGLARKGEHASVVVGQATICPAQVWDFTEWHSQGQPELGPLRQEQKGGLLTNVLGFVGDAASVQKWAEGDAGIDWFLLQPPVLALEDDETHLVSTFQANVIRREFDVHGESYAKLMAETIPNPIKEHGVKWRPNRAGRTGFCP